MQRKMLILRGSFPISATPMSALEQTLDWQVLAELGQSRKTAADGEFNWTKLA